MYILQQVTSESQIQKDCQSPEINDDNNNNNEGSAETELNVNEPTYSGNKSHGHTMKLFL